MLRDARAPCKDPPIAGRASTLCDNAPPFSYFRCLMPVSAPRALDSPADRVEATIARLLTEDRRVAGLIVLGTIPAVALVLVCKLLLDDLFEPILKSTMLAGFMLPVSTPCNAIVYGSGYVPLGRMIRWGLALDIAGVVVIIVLVRALTPLIR